MFLSAVPGKPVTGPILSTPKSHGRKPSYLSWPPFSWPSWLHHFHSVRFDPTLTTLTRDGYFVFDLKLPPCKHGSPLPCCSPGSGAHPDHSNHQKCTGLAAVAGVESEPNSYSRDKFTKRACRSCHVSLLFIVFYCYYPQFTNSFFLGTRSSVL